MVPGEQRMTGVESLDASRQARLVRLAGLAAQALDAQAAVLAFSGLDRCWVHAPDWPMLAALADDQAFHAHVLAAPDAIAVSDALCDPRLASSPLVTGAPGIRFCAGVPLLASDQTRFGTLCVVATQPHRSEPDQLAELQGIAELVVDQLELHREAMARAQAEATVAAERERLATVVESLPFNFWMCDAAGRYVLQNSVGQRAWGAHVGLLPEETAVPPDVSARWAATNRRVLAGETIRAETCYLRGGEAIHVEEFLAPVRDATGTIWGLVGINLDIGERRRAEERLQASEARLRTAIESLPFDFWICDAAGRYIMNNATCRSHWGSHIGQTPDESDVTPDVTGLWAQTNQRVLNGETLHYEATYGTGAEARDVEAILAPVQSEAGIIGLVGVNIDITERKRAEARIRHLADHDPLTGLPNRRMFQERLSQAVSRGRRNGELTALLLLDLDAFKGVNDALGHDAGDAVLCEVATRLRAGRRRHDTVARLGGDEFALILEGLRQPRDAGHIAAQILAALQQPFVHADREIGARGSIGIALFPLDARDASDLVRHADSALYRAKASNRGGWQEFDAAMRIQLDRRRGLDADLRRALCRSEFAVYYQPIVDLAPDAPVSFEALVRWRHPDRGLLLPGEFLQVAEETGLAAPLGDFVLRQAAMDARRWTDAGIRIGRIAVNMAAPQFAGVDLDSAIGQALADTGLPAELLEIEVTEGVFLGSNVGVVADILGRLHRRGVSIALDDFGTGYASLTHLRRFPIDKLKIDRSFVADILEDPNDAAIVRTIIELGHSLGLKIVAEGVETQAQLEFLTRHRCDQMQGYLIAAPAPAAEAMERAAAHRPVPMLPARRRLRG